MVDRDVLRTGEGGAARVVLAGRMSDGSRASGGGIRMVVPTYSSSMTGTRCLLAAQRAL
jgi:hypothetical protein